MTHHLWYVSSPHKVGPVGSESPYGVRHARQPGKTFTECGESALNWPMFWDRPFKANNELMCQACANSVVQQEFGTLPRQRDPKTVAEAS